MRLFTAILLLVWASVKVRSQVNEWPEILRAPSADEPEDTPSVSFDGRQTWYENTFKSEDNLRIFRGDSQRTLEQNVQYELSIDTALGRQNEYLNLSGSVKKEDLPVSDMSLGLDWRPVMKLNSGNGWSGLFGMTEIGPAFDWNAFGLPVGLRTGLTVLGWNDSLPGRLTDAHMDEFVGQGQGDAGIYGGMVFGDGLRPIKNLPLYIETEAYGRVTDSTSRLITAKGSFLFAHEFPSEDSIFFYYADSLSSGQEGSLAEEKFINVTQRTARSFQLVAALKGKARRRLLPSMYYSYSRYSVFYDPTLKLYNDKYNRVHSLNFLFANVLSKLIDYSGGLKFDWEKEDKMHRSKGMGRVVTGNNIDSLSANVRDFNGFRIEMTHELSRTWENGAGVHYIFDISRYTRRYPNKFFSDAVEIDTFEANDDNHWVVSQHRLEIEPVSKERFRLNLHGAFARDTSVYLKKERSAENSSDRSYSVGVTVDYLLIERLEFSEDLTAFAKRTKHAFPDMHKDKDLDGRPDDPAPYSRRFSSNLNGKWRITDVLSINGGWEETYWDDGYWNSKEYFDSLPADFREEYKIDRKSLEWKMMLSTSMTLTEMIFFEIGAEFGDINYRIFENTYVGYVENPLGMGKILTPFFLCRAVFSNNLRLKGKIRYTNFDIFGDLRKDGSGRKPLLDFDLSLMMEF